MAGGPCPPARRRSHRSRDERAGAQGKGVPAAVRRARAVELGGGQAHGAGRRAPHPPVGHAVAASPRAGARLPAAARHGGRLARRSRVAHPRGPGRRYRRRPARAGAGGGRRATRRGATRARRAPRRAAGRPPLRPRPGLRVLHDQRARRDRRARGAPRRGHPVPVVARRAPGAAARALAGAARGRAAPGRRVRAGGRSGHAAARRSVDHQHVRERNRRTAAAAPRRLGSRGRWAVHL